jgi:hypothetical protein
MNARVLMTLYNASRPNNRRRRPRPRRRPPNPRRRRPPSPRRRRQARFRIIRNSQCWWTASLVAKASARFQQA